MTRQRVLFLSLLLAAVHTSNGVVLNNGLLKKVTKQTTTTTFETGIGCGTIPMRANHVIQIQSSNFGIANANYFNNEACSWTFTAKSCDLSVYCPCFNVPRSFGCLEDYLKIGYLKFQDRFCGENPPAGVYRANGDSLTLKFRSNYKETGRGFLCLVRCTKTGSADPVPPTAITCPAGTTNPFGNPAA